jgi:phage terminase large subunit-like protein
MGAYDLAAHLTGEYPDWWEGRRFTHPVSAWAAGKGFETTRDIMQLCLLGEVSYKEGRKTVDGRGVIPGKALGQPTWKSGVADLVDTIHVRHISGGWSDLGFKSYEQGRGSFEGTGKHVIWDDEEPPLDVYGEQLIRTATVDGIVMITFTPLEGMSEVVLQFMPADQRPDFTT